MRRLAVLAVAVLAATACGASVPHVSIPRYSPSFTASQATPTRADPLYSGYVQSSGVVPYVLDDPGGSTTNGTKAQVWNSATGNAANEQWAAINHGSYVTIQLAEDTAVCLDVTGFGTANGTKVQLWACNGGKDQQWAPQPDGTMEAVNATNVRGVQVVLDDPGAGGSGTQFQIWQENGLRQQQWQPSLQPPPGYTTQIFDDQFTATSLTNNWVTYLGAQGSRWDDMGYLPAPYSGPNTPGNNNQAMFGPSQVKTGGGATLTAQKNMNQYSDTFPWTSGILSTETKFALPVNSPWYVQARVWMPDTSQGMWPAIWFLPNSGSAFNELDGYEGGWVRADNGTAAPNYTMHSDFFANQGQQQSAYLVTPNLSAGYHTYGVEFVPGQSITVFLDGQQVWQVLASNGVTISAEPYQIMLNLQVAANQASGWHTITNANTPTSVMKVAEVQAYTP